MRAVQRLDLALLVVVQHQRVLGRIEIKPNHVGRFLHKPRIVAEFERASQVWFKAVGFPDSLDHRRRTAQVLRERSCTPVRGVGRLFLSRCLDDSRGNLLPDRRLSSVVRRVFLDSRRAMIGKAVSPQRHRFGRRLQFGGDVFVHHPFGGGQHDFCPEHESHRRAASARPTLKSLPFLVRKIDFTSTLNGVHPSDKDKTRQPTISSDNCEALQ